jgi:hypothetical protein
MMNASPVREEEIIETIGNGIVEEGRHTEEPFGNKVNPLHEHFEPHTVSQVDCGKVGNSEYQCNYISDTYIAPYSDIFKVVTLLDIPERFITPPAGKVDFYNTPYCFSDLCIYRTTRK